MKSKICVFAAALTLCMALCIFPVSAAAPESNWTVSDLYRESEYYTYLINTPLIGDWRTDLALVALSQVGYHEGDCPEDYAGGNTVGCENFMEYSSVYYGINDQWCAMFVSWCARQAGIPTYIINNAAGAYSDGVGGTRPFAFHIYSYSKNNYSPVVGDLVFFSSTGWGTDHVGIIVGLTDTGIYTVEGNSLNAVRLRYYDYDDEYIARYGFYATPPEESAQMELRFSTLDFVYTDAQHGHMPDGDPYFFDQLLAVQDRVFTIPINGFERAGLTLAGYVIERAEDGAWYCGDKGWLTEEELLKAQLLPTLIEDGSAWRFDSDWQAAGNLRLYCVWEAPNGNLCYDGALPEAFRKDAEGWCSPFPDLHEGHWYYEIVRSAVQAELIAPETLLRAEDAATRAEFADMLYRAAGSPALTKEAENFEDVTEDHAAYAAIVWARESGLVQGVGDNLFLPENAMSRQEMVTMLYRWLGGGALLDYGAEFTDADTVSDWAQDAMRWASSESLIQGMANETGLELCPFGTTSRAQSITVALRVLERLQAVEKA